ncbi:unnamed protein product [Euphydryas editha]|uniref:Uncharacterized protein n=1 Tax=Euphydryas editha TaxID=104508 RepID=A0AAU9UKU6_EUPED|nr:unnamed protein product [Euphydryas editha]
MIQINQLVAVLSNWKITVWYALWARGVIGSNVVKNDDGQNITVNGERFRDMIQNFFVPQLAGITLADMWLQQDGTTRHTARATIDLLKETFD